MTEQQTQVLTVVANWPREDRIELANRILADAAERLDDATWTCEEILAREG